MAGLDVINLANEMNLNPKLVSLYLEKVNEEIRETPIWQGDYIKALHNLDFDITNDL